MFYSGIRLLGLGGWVVRWHLGQQPPCRTEKLVLPFDSSSYTFSTYLSNTPHSGQHERGATKLFEGQLVSRYWQTRTNSSVPTVTVNIDYQAGIISPVYCRLAPKAHISSVRWLHLIKVNFKDIIR